MHDAPTGGVKSTCGAGISACASNEIIIFISKQVKEVSFTSVYTEMQLFRALAQKFNRLVIHVKK